MEAIEFRIGNLVFDTEQNKVDKITAIEENRVSLMNSKLPYTPIDIIEPIPLTEGWLIKGGFERSDTFESDFDYYNSDWFVEKDGEIFFITNIYISEKPEFDRITINTVHLLQNKWKYLTGIELEFKTT